MNKNRLITLLTDFGLQDVYVGVMKGVIAQINPGLNVVDLTHQIPPQDVAAGRFCLMNAYNYFPLETVHIAVVDPGVGSHRRGVAVEFAGGFLVGPDNGLFSGVLSQTSAISAVELTNKKYWRTPAPSTTFHGRDIFAAVGAYLAGGINIKELGDVIDPNSLVQLSMAEYMQTDEGINGCIQYVDRFGNLVTNIEAGLVKNGNWCVVVGDISIAVGNTYSDVKVGELVSLTGSHGWVEIAVNGGNAGDILQIGVGESVRVIWR
ncbi:SAM-dependent chlorinase/fluorinase [Ancylothrix sp. C2]|uniref:SAM hydrolase/SAM-dependent halogenase family protein n=1 Tax=Ancylothrix sp. D3o TaxID=2953691 RepID=UPI0021BB0E78|nr:SAM-dependent chlorinase/fluorinase [Ancylothrix sp. D3o]MCT7952116.1 SAM-dependent chlorinase/fluorinase [Ancylothrix sp. D3o]